MNKFLIYINKNRVSVLFLLLLFISLRGFINENKRQYLKTNNYVIGVRNKIFSAKDVFGEFFDIEENNKFLMEKNSKLMQELNFYKEQYTKHANNNQILECDFKYTSARVIKSTNRGNYNYFVVNKGTNDGIKIDMGVVDHRGIVGIIDEVYQDYSLGLSLFNKNVVIDGRIESNDYFGSVYWKGGFDKNLSMEGIPSYINLQDKDTVKSTGNSFIFPKGIPIGIVDNYKLENNSTFYNIEIKPLVNFYNLEYVYIIESIDYNKYKNNSW